MNFLINNCKEAHHCNCKNVNKCAIYTHPSTEVQLALNALMDAIAFFDDTTNSKSILILHSEHKNGVFHSITERKQIG